MIQKKFTAQLGADSKFIPRAFASLELCAPLTLRQLPITVRDGAVTLKYGGGRNSLKISTPLFLIKTFETTFSRYSHGQYL
jgi:hypothetical protein